VRCFSALSSGLTPPTPPTPPMKNARRAAAAGHKTTQRRQVVGAQLCFDPLQNPNP